MSDRFFLDTNIVVYAFDRAAPAKVAIANQLIEKALTTQNGVISYQVIQEFLNVALHKFKTPITIEDAHTYLEEVLLPLCEVTPSGSLYHTALHIRTETKYSFYDSVMLAAALESKCAIFYSEDLETNRKINTLTIRNPFL